MYRRDIVLDEEELLDAMKKAILRHVPQESVGVAFSGGVDSALLAALCLRLDYDIVLLTVGFAGSHDIIFARQAGESPRVPHHISEIDGRGFPEAVGRADEIMHSENISWRENGIAFWYIARLAKRHGLKYLLAANGIDELFCGYDAYRRILADGPDAVRRAVSEKLECEIAMMERVGMITAKHNTRLVQPFLDDEFARFAKTVPIYEKIRSPEDYIRKHIVRRAAIRAGVPEISANKRKKAMQYGSGIHKALLRISRS